MAELRNWSVTAGSNTGASADGWWAENTMDYDEVNDAAREDQAIVARWYKDVNGTLDSTGSANAYVLAANQTLTSLERGDQFRFKANFTNTGAATLNVDAIGATAMVTTGGDALLGGEIISGGVYQVIYDGTNFQVEGVRKAVPTLNVTGTDAIDLVDTGNPLNIGTLTGAHLAFDPDTIQAKSDETTAADLTLNDLGGGVNIGPQASGGVGGVSLFHSETKRASTTTDGADVFGTLLDLDNTGAVTNTSIGARNDNGGVLITAGADVRFQQTDSAGVVEDIWLLATRNAGVDLRYNNSVRLSTTSNGVTIDNGVSSALFVVTGADAAGEGGQINIEGAGSNTYVAVDNSSTGALRLLVKDGAEVALNAEPDGAVSLYHNNIERLATTSLGANLSGNVFAFDSAADINTVARILNTQGGHGHYTMTTTGEYRLYQTDSSGVVEDIWIVAQRNGGVGLRYNNLLRMETGANGVTVTGTLTATTDVVVGSDSVTTDAQFASGYKVNAATGSVAVTFGKTFGAAPIVMITAVNDGAASGNPNSPIVLQSVTTTGFNAYVAGDIPEAFRNFNWVAMESGI